MKTGQSISSEDDRNSVALLQLQQEAEKFNWVAGFEGVSRRIASNSGWVARTSDLAVRGSS